MGGFFEFLKNNSNKNNGSSSSVWNIGMVDRTTGREKIFRVEARTLNEAIDKAVKEYGHAYSLKR